MNTRTALGKLVDIYYAMPDMPQHKAAKAELKEIVHTLARELDMPHVTIIDPPASNMLDKRNKLRVVK